MTFEEKLSVAAREAGECIAASIPSDAGADVQFSDRFLNNMRDYMNNWRKQSKHPVIRGILAAAAVVLLIFGLLMASSPEIRAAVTGWIRSIYEGFTVYRYNGFSNREDNPEAAAKYELTWVPEGYELDEKLEIENTVFYFYQKDGYNLTFAYSTGGDENDFMIDMDKTKSKIISYREGSAELLISESEDVGSVIIWSDNDEELFIISAFADEQTLLKLADSVKEAN